MENQESKNKKIAKNTLYLYIRMILVMIVSLFTVRIVLKNLGVEDYGIYNLIGGVVVLFNFIANSSSVGTQRYLNFSLGENDLKKTQKIFSSSLIIHIIVALIIFILAETFGGIILKNYLIIPSNRFSAAKWVYQFSIITTVINIIKIPYNASIIAHERMAFFAFLSIFECIGKLLIAYILQISIYDKLILYGFSIGIINLFLFALSILYVNRYFLSCRFKLHSDKYLYKELISFSGWTLLSSIGSTCSNQVLLMILNKFFGVIANAAMGIANQVNSVVFQFISNFEKAFQPQIIKSYASKDMNYLLKLIFRTSKFSFFLLWFLILPLSLNAEFVLTVWLTDIPQNTVIFLRIILISSLIDAITDPLWMLVYAIGNIKNYQIVAFISSIITIPILYILFSFGFSSQWCVIIKLILNIIFGIYRFFYLRVRINFPIKKFLSIVILPSIVVIILSLSVSLLSFTLTKGLLRFFISCFVTVIINSITMYFCGCNQSERLFLKNSLKKMLTKLQHSNIGVEK